MISQAMEMEEKLAEMERTYHFRLMEQVLDMKPPRVSIGFLFFGGFWWFFWGGGCLFCFVI